ncbi:MAG: hypothetical protein HFH68_15705 [Lachnospiraceae bacterium]|nr:hypothetical protein [Lachnospiraceae bacterium]
MNILCGASIFAKEVIKESDILFQYVCDNDESKIGKLWEGIEIIHYNLIEKLISQSGVCMFLANRYASGTVKKLEKYFEMPGFKLYGFISDDYQVTEITSIMDYYEKCNLIKYTMGKIASMIPCKGSIDDKVLIYTMRKVGTTSIHRAVERSLGSPQLFLHTMFDGTEYRDEVKKLLEMTPRFPYYKVVPELIKKNIKEGKQIKVITSVREPVARNISQMFFDLPVMLGTVEAVTNTRKQNEAMAEIFEDIYYRLIDHDFILNWFDLEVKRALGIDIYEYSFDKENGYMVIEKENIQLLVLKLEKLDSCEGIIGEFIGNRDFKLIKEKSSEDYWYKPLYDLFREKFIPNKEYLQKMYGSRFMKHFYTDEEIEGFYKKYNRI